MIARVWHGFTKPEHADAYESHLKPELLPGLNQKPRISRQLFAAPTGWPRNRTRHHHLWESLDNVRALAGDDYEKALIPEDRLPLLSRYHARAAHYEIVSTNEPIRR
jgi:hypothetical protein